MTQTPTRMIINFFSKSFILGCQSTYPPRLHSIKRGLHSVKRGFTSVKRGSTSMKRCLTSVKRSEHPSKHESAGIGPTPFGAQKFAMAEFHLNRCDGRRGSGFGQSAVRLVHTITGDDRHNRTRGQYTAEKNLKKKFPPYGRLCALQNHSREVHSRVFQS